MKDVLRILLQLLPGGDVIKEARPRQEQAALLGQKQWLELWDGPARVAVSDEHATRTQRVERGLKSVLAHAVKRHIDLKEEGKKKTKNR